VSLNLPGTIAAGNLLLAFIRMPASAIGVSWPAGWDVVQTAGSVDAANDTTEIRAKIADGTEGATISLTIPGGAKLAGIVWKITGADSVSTGARSPESGGLTSRTTANIDPISFTPVDPGGTEDYLWFSCIGMDSETATATNGTLSNVSAANTGTAGAVATNCMIWGGSLASTASSIDFSAWTSTAPNAGVGAVSVAVYPTPPVTLVLSQGFVDFNDPGVL